MIQNLKTKNKETKAMKQILCLLLFPMLLCFCGQENTDDTNKQEKDKLNSNANQSNKKIDPLENQTKENNHNKDLKSNNLTYKYSNW